MHAQTHTQKNKNLKARTHAHTHTHTVSQNQFGIFFHPRVPPFVFLVLWPTAIRIYKYQEVQIKLSTNLVESDLMQVQ